MLKSLLFSVVFLLTACTSLPKVQHFPERAPSVSTFKVENSGHLSLLFVQFEPAQWRWIQTDPLGAPIARVLLTTKGWQQDGFVMPNQQAKLLFSALANELSPNQPIFELDNGWKVEKQANRFVIVLPDETIWKVETLTQ